jgi:hypothetical protein
VVGDAGSVVLSIDVGSAAVGSDGDGLVDDGVPVLPPGAREPDAVADPSAAPEAVADPSEAVLSVSGSEVWVDVLVEEPTPATLASRAKPPVSTSISTVTDSATATRAAMLRGGCGSDTSKMVPSTHRRAGNAKP